VGQPLSQTEATWRLPRTTLVMSATKLSAKIAMPRAGGGLFEFSSSAQA
jgi:hypothetical protein